METIVGKEETPNQKMHYVVATCTVVKEEKYLIAKRASYEKAFPNQWTVPGGKLESKDFTSRPKDTGELWYNICEDLIEREVMEEVGLTIDRESVGYITSLAYIRIDGIPTIIISLYANYKDGEVKLAKSLTEYAWVTLEEAKKYDLIDGIYDELTMLDKHLKGEKLGAWKKH
ncbi:MAG: NUDIX domain-containing protein [archaeon]|jgi:8-oxo-dGTP pyrophosphatase MutT (NUDIX family)